MRRRGQALTEFALIMPVLLFVTMGIFDFGRVLFTYAMASNALRNGLRNAEVLGYAGEEAVYANCGKMREDIRSVFFAGPSTVNVYYIKATSPDPLNPETKDCPEGNIQFADEEWLESGDILRIEVQSTVEFITPFITQIVPSLTFNFEGQRTVVMNVPLSDNFEVDTDYDGLLDQWETDNFGDLNQIGTNDPDGDGCNNGCEETRGTDPNNPDTDSDGLKDGDEAYLHKTNPFVADTDGDTLSDGDEVNTHNTNPKNVDTDGDGITDDDEVAAGTDPGVSDTDGDGLTDGVELAACTDPLGVSHDTDSDGLSDYDEVTVHHTSGCNPDTDGDGLNDGLELLTYNTDVFGTDTDGDTLSDGEEVYTHGTSPTHNDSDGDGLVDNAELSVFGTNPALADSDDDGLNDRDEIYTYGTGAMNPDSDDPATCPDGAPGDGLKDGDEVLRHGTDPLDCDTNDNTYTDAEDIAAGRSPRLNDSDNDGLADTWEIPNFGNLDASGADDPDSDGCNNECEESRGLIPTDPDFDDDGLFDGDEITTHLTLPKDPDSDDDGLSDGDEITHSTNPNNPDSDSDGLKDGDEVARGIDPTDPDTDGDGLRDGTELLVHLTDPNNTDSDDGGAGDGLDDYREVMVTATDPLNSDSDGDGLKDGEEVITYTTLPRDPDTDDDGLSDGAEILTYQTNPKAVDSDNDGLTDPDEINTYHTYPMDNDSDDDGLFDGAEVNTHHTNPLDSDSDDDDLNDFDEVQVYHTEPDDSDSDEDGLTDGSEVRTYETDPLDADTDNDTVSDGTEVTNGTDPLHAPILTVADISVDRASGTATFTVTLQYPSGGDVTVRYTTWPMPSSAIECTPKGNGNGNIGNDCDYLLTSGTLTFGSTGSSTTINVPVYGGKQNTPNEIFSLILSGATNATVEQRDGRNPGEARATFTN